MGDMIDEVVKMVLRWTALSSVLIMIPIPDRICYVYPDPAAGFWVCYESLGGGGRHLDNLSTRQPGLGRDKYLQSFPALGRGG